MTNDGREQAATLERTLVALCFASHVYVNQVGPVGTLNFVGGSTVVSADGEVDVQAGDSEEEIPSVGLLLPARSSVRQDYLSELRSPTPGVRNVTPPARPEART